MAFFRHLCSAILLISFMTSPAAAQAPRPNFVLILIDDAALMDLGAYGGEANTPNIDELAAGGTLFTQMRATPFCAPSRAMLMTGLDNHTAGLGTIREVLPREYSTEPGYRMALEPGVVTIAERLKRDGYRTYMTGKWHLGHGSGELPIDHGFDRSFLLDASGADNWKDQPYLPYYREAPWFEDREPATLPENFYSSTFLVEQLIEYIESDADAERPFFAYLAFQAVHIPVQAPREFTQKYVDTYSVGWETIRKARWQRAQKLGLVAEDAPMSAPSATLGKWNWDALSKEQREFAARSMAVNAGMLEAMDVEIGRLINYLRENGDYDNTIFLITSDNGPEAGDPVNTAVSSWLKWQGYNWDIETLGERDSYVAIGPEWAQAASGPTNLFKFHAGDGGLRVPLVLAGPGVPIAKQVDAFSIMSDIAPTILDLARVDPAFPGALPMSGRSMIPLLSGDKAQIYGPEEPIGFETSGQAALFRGSYKLVRSMPPHGDGVWRLYNIVSDPGETSDLSQDMMDLKEELLHEYRLYANRVGVLELPKGYIAQEEIARNIVRRLLEFYWGWLLLALGLLAAGLWSGYRLARFGLRGWVLKAS